MLSSSLKTAMAVTTIGLLNSKNPTKNWKWVGGFRSHLDKKKIGKSSKNKILRLYNSPLLGGARGATLCACMQHFYPVFCDFVIVLQFG